MIINVLPGVGEAAVTLVAATREVVPRTQQITTPPSGSFKLHLFFFHIIKNIARHKKPQKINQSKEKAITLKKFWHQKHDHHIQ